MAPVQVVPGLSGNAIFRADLTVCDNGPDGLNVGLWEDKSKSIKICKVGDAVLLADIEAMECRQKTAASTGSLSKIVRLDGTSLDRYRGSSVVEHQLRTIQDWELRPQTTLSIDDPDPIENILDDEIQVSMNALTHRPLDFRADGYDSRGEDMSLDPISSASPSPPLPPLTQAGLSVVVPDYLPTQFVLDNIEHFKSSDHLTPKKQQETAGDQITTPKQHSLQHPRTPSRPRPWLARTHSDIIPDDVPTQLAMQEIDRYRSAEYYRPNNGNTGTSKIHRPSTPQQDRASIISHPRTPSTSSSTTPTNVSGSQDQSNRRRPAEFSPFKPLFPPPPPVAETKSPKRRSTPKKATPKKRQRQSISVVDDTDPIEDADSDDDWQVFWNSPTKDVNEGDFAKHPRAAASPSKTPSTTPSRPTPKTATSRPALKPPEPLGPKLLQIFREEVHKGNAPGTATKSAAPVLHQRSPPAAPSVSGPPPASSSVPPTIRLDEQVISYASRLTPIKDLTANNPQRRYHILGLIQLIAPAQEVLGFAGKPTSKAVMTVYIGAKEYRQKTTASTRSSSRIVRMDGTLLGQYRGDSVVEDHLRELSRMRETLGHHLLDSGGGIARDPSFYLTLDASLLLQQDALEAAQLPTRSDFDASVDDRKAQEVQVVDTRDQVKVKMEPEDDIKPIIKLEPMVKVKIEPGTENTVGGNTGAVSGPTKWSTIRGIVVYHKLNVDGDESKGWEIGAVTMTTKKFFRVQTSSFTSWIDKAKPQRLIQFDGAWSKKEGMLRISDSAREPEVLKEKGPDLDRSSMKIMSFGSVREVIESRYMGVALVEGYIDVVTFPEDIMDQFWADDTLQ
ncbi:hypothetical protein BGZ95_006041 [Linnemannia exigua]|uniref:Uncharacterized protein n=1 Tax=Linnemannia exigua TaxID=604196 RepID=A0AAD4DGP8_9FUNG|nr:hypothetical protein BGZ95_006041 [Linnemannia exigua]